MTAARSDAAPKISEVETMDEFVEKVEAVLTRGDVLTGTEVNTRAAGVWRQDTIQARAIVRPTSTEEVAAVMALCHEHGQSVVMHGGLTGLVHAADAGPTDLVVSMERMNAIEAIDTLGRTMTVQAGTPLQQIHEAAAAEGLMFPVDLGARGSCQIGGNVATNAGGLRVIRYGMTRDNVLGLEAVLADGTVVSSLNQMIKNNSGYDLKQLFIGSEGTLGVVTRLILRLRTALTARHTALVAFPDYEAVLKFLSYLDGALSGNLSAYEVMWPDYFLYTREKIGGAAMQIDPGRPFYAIVETLGADQEREAETFENALTRAHENGLLTDAIVAKSDSESAAIWRIRDEVEHLFELGEIVFFDVSLAVRPMESYVAEVRQRLGEQTFKADFFSFGHLGDGNLHFAVAVGDDTEKHRHAIESAIYEPLAALGGSVSAEHGIGLEKKPWLSVSRSENEIALMRRLKQALDPKGILNPGKIFDYDGPQVLN
jgi:FAD/FMN-containing dehydrogenase